MRDLLFSELAHCKVVKGIVQFHPGIATDAEFKEFSNRIRCDLLDGKIPHFRAVGLYVKSRENTSALNVLSKMKSVGRSYAELMPIVGNLVYAEGHGMEQSIQIDDTMGSLYGTGDVTSSNGSLHWKSDLYTEAKALVKNQEICSLGRDCSIHILLKRGVGEREYYENERILRNTEFKPLRTLYDLNEYLLLHLYEPQSNRLHFIYKREVNDEVLEKLLQEYAKDVNFRNAMEEGGELNASAN